MKVRGELKVLGYVNCRFFVFRVSRCSVFFRFLCSIF